MKVFKIPDNIYHAKIYIINKADNKSLIKYFKKQYAFAYEPDNDFDAMHYRVENKEKGIKHNYIIFLKKFANTPTGIGILNHELLHLINDVLEGVGMKNTGDAEEAYAYYFDYLTEKILNKLL
jgi:hypothetical protein